MKILSQNNELTFIKCGEVATLNEYIDFNIDLMKCNEKTMVSSFDHFDFYLASCYGGNNTNGTPLTFGKIWRDDYIDHIDTPHFLVMFRYASDYQGFSYDIYRQAWL